MVQKSAERKAKEEAAKEEENRQAAQTKRYTERERLAKVRELTPDDGMELIGIVASMGANPTIGHNIGLAISASQGERRNPEVAMQAGAAAVMQALYAALRSRDARDDARVFLYSIWAPPLGPIKGDTDEEREKAKAEKKAELFKKLGFEGYLRIADAMRKTEDFDDFLDYARSMLGDLPSITESLMSSSGDTDSPTPE